MSEWLIRRFAAGDKNGEGRGRVGALAGAVAIACNLLLVAVKALAALLSGSVAVAADAVNNLSDAASGIISLMGFRLAGKPADREHPFGHARYEYLAGLTVAVIDVLCRSATIEELDLRHCDFVTAEHERRLRREMKRLRALQTSVEAPR